ncbi:hypothetical protein M427DRAFT_57915 [Gonapodya prolifera JEL478]|uniref:Uncharacterized protein n=1 Tax=Gonapodya prolifera (strain JEL478) TaxID=1344416 RepID=A0A139ABL1_GONPJ|nr:hypothetical protein M427DRAFT_57915 [Gonapodya prolifera JEL478]|eukprot:KXS14150.1 hypothetical protein M427DRAFT_57915 [Gonapodya prolifera JEL478]
MNQDQLTYFIGLWKIFTRMVHAHRFRVEVARAVLSANVVPIFAKSAVPTWGNLVWNEVKDCVRRLGKELVEDQQRRDINLGYRSYTR